jgi:hypothetical protein
MLCRPLRGEDQCGNCHRGYGTVWSELYFSGNSWFLF